MNAPQRRGACPALSAPMQTGDGLLVRLSPLSGGLSPNQLIGLCESAARHGNGTVEVTARGSFQFRGFSQGSARRFAVDVDALAILARTGVPVEVSPLAGIDPSEIANPLLVAEAIRQRIAAAGLERRLGPKVSVVVDGGGHVPMDSVAADVRLTAEAHDGRVLWRVAVAGDAGTATPVGVFGDERAVQLSLGILETIGEMGMEARARDLESNDALIGQRSTLPPSVLPDISPARGEIGNFALAASPATLAMGENNAASVISPLAGEMSGRTVEGNVERQPRRTSVTIPVHNGTAVPIALPFGHIDAPHLVDLVRRAESLGVSDIRPDPQRRLLLICPSTESAAEASKAATALGFLTDPADPRASIAACPGAPACASGKIAARTIAKEVAGAMTETDLSIHISGCAKGCARQAAADITVIGGENGAGLVVGGTTKAHPLAYTSEADLPRAIIAVSRQINALRGRGRSTSVARLTQEDKARLIAAFGQGQT